MRRSILSLIWFLLLALPAARAQQPVAADSSLAARYRPIADRLIQGALADSLAFERLAYLCDTFGPRFSGTDNLERAIDWILGKMRLDGLQNVRGEPVMVPRWVRGEESAALVEPRAHPMQILGLGGSIGTPSGGVTAPVLTVRSFDELRARSSEVRGRIVLYNVPFTTYGETVRYRSAGAAEAARHGAVAALVRSVGPVSLYTPHTGSTNYAQNVPPIPAAAVTVEDAELIQRLQDRGERVVLRLAMGAQRLPDAPSRNVVAEIVGSEKPEEVVVLGGHIDSWDVGQGAVDDGGGSIAAWEAVRLMQRLGLRPRRTVRVVLWTNEENGLRGGTGYYEAHRHEIENHLLAMESDAGVFRPQGFGLTASDAARARIQEVARLLEPLQAGTIFPSGGGADIGPLMRAGVPGMGLVVDNTKYFWVHHTHADTVDKVDPHDLNRCVAALAVMAFVVADMPERLPR